MLAIVERFGPTIEAWLRLRLLRLLGHAAPFAGKARRRRLHQIVPAMQSIVLGCLVVAEAAVLRMTCSVAIEGREYLVQETRCCCWARLDHGLRVGSGQSAILIAISRHGRLRIGKGRTPDLLGQLLIQVGCRE